MIATDENVVEALILKPNRREKTRLGRHSATITVGNYDDEEFEAATRALGELGGGLVYGAKHAPELRVPWVLRGAAARLMEGTSADRTVVLPPLLGPQMFEVADERFSDLGDLRDDLRRLAAAYLNDLENKRHHGDVLASLQLFSIRQDVVREHLDREAIQDLVEAGLLRRSAAFSGDAIYVVEVPELFGHELAARIASLLPKRVNKDASEAAKWLIAKCSRILFGDAIGAHAISSAMHDVGGPLYIELLNALLRLPPHRERLALGARMVTLLPSMGLVDVNVRQDGMLTMSTRGKSAKTLTVQIDDEDLMTVADMDGWLILSQLREFRIAFEDENGNLFNLAAPLLLELGSCKEVLRRPGPDLDGFHTHAIDGGAMSCFKNGIAEPITWAIAELLSHDIPGIDRDAWVKKAAESGSAALVNRLGQALTHLSKLEGIGPWAKDMLETRFRPAIAAHPQFH